MAKKKKQSRLSKAKARVSAQFSKAVSAVKSLASKVRPTKAKTTKKSKKK